jgi:hypothetical protein
MRIQFRQGIVTAPPSFLQLNGTTVNLALAPLDQVNVAFADGITDYLHTERLPITSAWTGPFAAGPQSYWLFWDINTLTGQRTFGHTLLAPVASSTAPPTPAVDQHWFDTSTNRMKVFTGTGRWVNKIRVFAAKLDNGSILQSVGADNPAFTGSQVSTLEAVPTSVGALVFDVNGDAVKRNGFFFTTEDVVVTGVASAAQLKIGAIAIQAVAVANIPAYSIVHFTDFNQIDLATNLTTSGAYGLIEGAASAGAVVNVSVEGLVTNPLWNWVSAGVNAPLYVSMTGELTTVQPPQATVVATVVDTNTILLRASIVVVNGGTAGPAAPQNLTIKEVSNNYVLVLADGISTMVRVSVPFGTDGYVYLPTDAAVAIPIGAEVILSSSDFGTVTVRGSSGVVVRSPQSLTIERKYGRVIAIKVAANTWEIDGQLRAQTQFTVLPINAQCTFNVLYPSLTVQPAGPETLTYGVYLSQITTNILASTTGTLEDAFTSVFNNYQFSVLQVWCTALPTFQWARATVLTGGVTLVTTPIPYGRVGTAEGVWTQFGPTAPEEPSWYVTRSHSSLAAFTMLIEFSESSGGPILGSFTTGCTIPNVLIFKQNFMNGVDMTGVNAVLINSIGVVTDINNVTLSSYLSNPCTVIPGGDTLLITVTQLSGDVMTYAGAQGGAVGTLGAQYTTYAFGSLRWGYADTGAAKAGSFLVTITSDYTGSVQTVTTGVLNLSWPGV